MLDADVEGNRAANRRTAVEFIWPAYELSQQRLDSLNRRLEWLIATPAGLITIMVTASDSERSIFSCWFYVAVILAVVASGIAYWGRRRAVVNSFALRTVLDYDHSDPAEFDRWLIDWAGKHITSDGKANGQKAWLADLASLFTLVELGFLIIWSGA